VIFTTDHGFYFGEHGLFGKMVFDEEKMAWYRSPLYEEITHIPLLIHYPGAEPHQLSALTSAVDLMPTVLQMAGIDPHESVSGRSLLPQVKGESDIGREFVVTSNPLFDYEGISRAVDGVGRRILEPFPATITTSKEALLYSVESEEAELYDLELDPRQEKNIIRDQPERARALHEKYLQLLLETNTKSHIVEPRRRLSIEGV